MATEELWLPPSGGRGFREQSFHPHEHGRPPILAFHVSQPLASQRLALAVVAEKVRERFRELGRRPVVQAAVGARDWSREQATPRVHECGYALVPALEQHNRQRLVR